MIDTLFWIFLSASVAVFPIGFVVFAIRARSGRLASQSPRKTEHPYRDVMQREIAKCVQVVATDEGASTVLREIEAKIRRADEADKYEHALEAIATLNQDTTAQRIAKQALGRLWK